MNTNDIIQIVLFFGMGIALTPLLGAPGQTVKRSFKILVAEEDPASQRLLRILLKPENYKTIRCSTKLEARQKMVTHRPDIAIWANDVESDTTVTSLRDIKEWARARILVVSSRVTVAEKVQVLDAGADGYIIKPFDDTECLARLRVLRRFVESSKHGYR